ncbi:glycosyltransferase family 39 protein [bacterium]|nr:glycosyltransferase family 39 protein [bacterium]
MTDSNCNNVNHLPRPLVGLFVFLFALLPCAIQVIYIASPVEYVQSDMKGYIERAWRLTQADNFVTYDAFYPAGTTYIFSAIFQVFNFVTGLSVLTWLQVGALALAVLFTFLLAEELFQWRRGALWGALFASLFYPFFGQASFFMSEPLFIAMTLFAMWFFLKINRTEARLEQVILLGLLLGWSMLLRGQGICFAATITLYGCFGFKRIFRNPQLLLAFSVALTLPLYAQAKFNQHLTNTDDLFLSSNGAFNAFLGQSRLEALGVHNPGAGYYYVFHNNNAFFDQDLSAPQMFKASIHDREFFMNQVAILWQQDFKRQIVRSLQSVIELFSPYPEWPLRLLDVPEYYEKISRIVFLVLIMIPVLYTLLTTISFDQERSRIIFLFLPVAMTVALIFLTMGQPRYLIPFQYLLIILSIPCLRDKFARKFLVDQSPVNPRVLTAISRIVLVTLLLLSATTAIAISRALKSTSTARTLDFNQYFKVSANELLRFEFGIDTLISPAEEIDHTSIRLSGFRNACSGKRNDRQIVDWCVYTNYSGTIEIFIANSIISQVNAVEIYLSDYDSNLRTTLIRSGKFKQVAVVPQSGSWYRINMRPEVRKSGVMKINLRELTGSGVKLSALRLLS